MSSKSNEFVVLTIEDLYECRPEWWDQNKNKLDISDLRYLLTEISVDKALEFFEIRYDAYSDIMQIPLSLDVKEAREVVDAYLTIVNDRYVEKNPEGLNSISPEILEKAKEYDEFTEEYRGADDGTFAYCGAYMRKNLEFIDTYMTEMKKAFSC